MDFWKKKFIIIWSGQLFSILSSAIVGYSVMFWLSIETKSAEVLSYAVLATLLPQALLGPIAGVYVDRWKRKLTMIAADSFVALCSLILGGLFYFDQAELGLIYLLMALVCFGLQSCLFQEEDYFDDSSANRATEEVKQYSEHGILHRSGLCFGRHNSSVQV